MRDLVAGMAYLGKGQRWVARNGRWWGFGLLPALITLVLYAGALGALVFWGGDLAAWATPFADDWGSPWRGILRGVFVALLFAGGLLLSVLTFTAVTLVIGEPFYEKLAERVEESEGGCPPGPELPLWRELWTALTDSVYVLLRAAGFGILLFALGFIPVIGQTVIPAIGFCVSGFFLTVELSTVAMQRRGIPVREQMRMLRGRKALAVGFGTPVTLLFLIPFVSVLLMPGAVAGATLLVRDLAGSGEDEGREAAGSEVSRDGDGAFGPAATDGHGAPGAYGPPGSHGPSGSAASAPYGASGPYGTPGPQGGDRSAGNPYASNPYAGDPQAGSPYGTPGNPYSAPGTYGPPPTRK
ncbi:EI24 domain-containing protein [Streptomyces sp. NPDC003077]|uniref:EI24 domain-containing protein n=1 Tax=Streptomyces sp. NPDC003077 TaxID=3154443 RepID=UPI0033BCA989